MTEIQNADVGATGPSTDLSTLQQPAGTTRVENGVAYDVAGKSLGQANETFQAPQAAGGVDYAALAKKYGGQPAPSPAAASAGGVDYAALAKKYGGQPAPANASKPSTAPASAPLTEYQKAAAQATTIGPRHEYHPELHAPIDERLGLWTPQQFEDWMDDVKADVQNGTHATWVGGILHYFGAKGTNYGVAPGAAQMTGVGAIPEGVADFLQSGPEAGKGHPVAAANKVVGGAMKIAAPLMVTQPEAMAAVVPGILAGNLASKAAAHFGADEDTQEAVGNVAGLLAGGLSVKKVHVDQFSRSVYESTAAESEYNLRTKELARAQVQAEEAETRVKAAEEAEAAGKGTRQQTTEARNIASETVKSVNAAREALRIATEGKAEAAVNVAKATQKITQGKKIAKPTTPEEIAKSKADFQTAIPSGPGKAAYTDEDYDVVRPYLEKHHAAQAPVNNPEAVYDALESQRVGIENRVKPWIQEYGKEALLLTDDSGKPVSVKQKLVDALTPDDKITAGFLDESLKELEKYNTTDPSVSEADALRKVLNDENRAILQKNHWDIATARATDPAFAARYELNDILRDGVYDRLIDKGVKGARELRQDERSIIPVRNAADRMIPKTNVVARGTGEASSTRKVAAWLTRKAGIGVGAAAGVATGIPGAAEVGGIVGGTAGDWAAQKIAPSGLTRAQLIERSMRVKATNGKTTEIDATGAQPSNPPIEPLPPPVLVPVHPMENSPLHAELMAHFDENPGDPNTSYADLASRLKQEAKIYTDHGVPVPEPLKKLKLAVMTAEVAELKAAQDAAIKAAKAAVAAPKPKPAALPPEATHVLTPEGKIEPVRPKAQAPSSSKEAGAQEQAPENPLNAETRAPFEKTEPHQQFPEDWADYFATFGMSPEQVAYHEAAHHALMHENGFESKGTIGQEHPEAKRVGGIARAEWDQSQFFYPKTGYINADATRGRLGDLLAQLYAGPVADELHFGIKIENNKGAAQDIKNANRLMELAGVPIDDKAAMLDAAQAKAKEVLTRPGVHEILSKYTSQREAGIPKEYLMTPETVQDMLKELDEAKQNGKTTEKALGVNEPANARLRGRGGENVARGAGEGVEGTARGALPATAAQVRAKAIESPLTQNLSYEAMKGMKEARESENLPINVKKDVLENPLAQRLAELKGTPDQQKGLKAGLDILAGKK